MFDRLELLHIIERNARISSQELAVMLGADESEIIDELEQLHKENIILGYSSVIDWSKTQRESVTAMIEIRITPQRNKGFDQIAGQLFRYPQVTSCYLMSGGFDLMLIIEDSTLREVASFVSEKVAPIDGVISTSTHFILKKYKSNGIAFDSKPEDNRETIIL
ncbi:MAG TPA: Lrp/AsnC family transcriptional regulator [Clostridiaceae bacterium]|jgi:DNA-binding Lrp family transcriptional regulator|nr:Lrp/AsnC family transcriptional regulator [Clostridiaceae bacterium]